VGLEAYTEQHNALLLAVQSFAQKVADYKKDFLQREVLVHRGFLQYLLGTFANALSQVCTDVGVASASFMVIPSHICGCVPVVGAVVAAQHTEIHKRRTIEWETKCGSAHSDAALRRLIEYSSTALAPFDRLVRELQVGAASMPFPSPSVPIARRGSGSRRPTHLTSTHLCPAYELLYRA
jgi:hypothetical protein